MTKKALETRRQRNREIAERDRQHRCDYCRVALGEPRVTVFGDPRAWCSVDCRDAQRDRDEAEGR